MQGHKVSCAAGKLLTIGRAADNDLAVPHDEDIADHQLELRWDGRVCALAHRGADVETLLGGEAVFTGEVTHGAWLRIGTTDISVYFEGHIPPPRTRDAGERARAEAALAALDADPSPLYTIVDAARDDRILELLRQSVEPYRSLYDGVEGETLAEAAPYLVGVPRGSHLRAALVHEGWGLRWASYLRSDKPLLELRRHLRQFLMVQLAGSEDPVYFRFYDPEVLRVYMQSCTPDERRPWFADAISEMLVEDVTAGYACIRLVVDSALAP
jgi:hypothetical protein